MLHAVAFASLTPEPQSADAVSAFAELERLTRERTAGFVHVQGKPAALEAVARHLERCARAQGRRVVRVAGLPTDDAWRELAARVSVGAVAGAVPVPSHDPHLAAAAIASASDGPLYLVVDHARTYWGRVASEELARLLESNGESGAADARSPLVIALSTSDAAPHGHALTLDAVQPADVRRFWGALADAAELPSALDRLEAVESWWQAASSTPAEQPADLAELSGAARRLLGRLVLSQRTWSVAQAVALGPSAPREELVQKRLLVVDAGGRLVSTGAPMPVLETDKADALEVARALEATWAGDHWASARASELLCLAGDFDGAEHAALRAIGALTDAAARVDFWSRWEASLAAIPAADATPRLQRSAELALRVGDVDRALGFARTLASRDDSCDAMLTLGRATTVRGDLTTAAIVLEKALAKADGPGMRARAAVEMAEVRYTMGELDAAREHADAALTGATDLGTRLSARNVLGKLMLARGAWADAEQHFAADACDAACGDDFIGELRARLNRAVALLSSGRRDEARVMLQAVQEEGERAGEPRAVSFALQNLATIAILKHEYPEALRLAEQAITVCRSVGEKIALARLIANLAELRLRLGLVAEAEQALAFGRKACGPGVPAARAAHFAIVAARIRLARGNTLEAATEVAAALATAGASSDGGKLGECYRVGARVALEDGDIPRAGHAIEKARAAASSIGSRAEVTLLDALRARAAGDPYLDLGLEALDLARQADDGELAREVHVVLHHALMDAGDVRAARVHVESALALQARVADALPGELRARFLARRDLAELARLGDALTDSVSIPSGPPSSDGMMRAPSSSERPSGLKPRSPRGIVGRDPAVLALLAAIQKIAPSDATVLVHGESGTGKELVAEALHDASDRRAGPMVKVNCAALVETLLLSELFGHEKGAFTGAASRRRGRFEMAEGGTLFLDEIGDISPRTQVALLRVLQEKTFERVGGVTPIRANVRIVCATHRDLKGMVARGEFREDLYYRLRGLVLEVPALRNRAGDLGAITDALLARIAAERSVPAKRVSPQALDGLSRHAWPGNVRELENALRAAALFADGDTLELEDFTANVEGLRELGGSPFPASRVGIRDASNDVEMAAPPLSEPPASGIERGSASPTDVAYAHVRSGVSLSDMKRLIEKDCIERALLESGGNITRAATLLGMKRPRLSQLVKQYGFGGADAEGDSESEDM